MRKFCLVFIFLFLSYNFFFAKQLVVRKEAGIFEFSLQGEGLRILAYSVNANLNDLSTALYAVEDAWETPSTGGQAGNGFNFGLRLKYFAFSNWALLLGIRQEYRFHDFVYPGSDDLEVRVKAKYLTFRLGCRNYSEDSVEYSDYDSKEEMTQFSFNYFGAFWGAGLFYSIKESDFTMTTESNDPTAVYHKEISIPSKYVNNIIGAYIEAGIAVDLNESFSMDFALRLAMGFNKAIDMKDDSVVKSFKTWELGIDVGLNYKFK